MTLRTRLMLWIGLVLIASLLFGGVLAYWHAVRKVDTEMHAAIKVGEHTIHNGVDDLEESAMPQRWLEQLIADLDGDRHVRAMLVAPAGRVIARSTPLLSDDAAPAWFYRMLARAPDVVHVDLPPRLSGYGSIIVATDSHNEIGEVWSDVVLMLSVLTVFCVLSAALVFWTTRRTLQPLSEIATGFMRIGSGDYSLRLREGGPIEVAQLRRGFNQMAERLEDMERRKQLLEEQLVGVQEEERAELARDLHDEIGPLLFAVSVDLTGVQHSEALQGDSAAHSRLNAARDAVSSMQQHVRAILGRLRPPGIEDLGLSHSIQRLVAFWQTRYPAVSFHVNVVDESVPAAIGARIYRVVQESISNALRHGSPSRIEVCVMQQKDATLLVEVRDNGSGMADERPTAGMGLRGMRERVLALGGELAVSTGKQGSGVTVSARLPVSADPSSDLSSSSQVRLA